MQQQFCSEIPTPNQTINDILLIDQNNQVFEDIPYDDADEANVSDEFHESEELVDDSSERCLRQ